MGSKTRRAEESTELGETLLQKELKGDQMSDAVCEEAGVVGSKRRIDNRGVPGQEGEARSCKKPKGDSSLQFPERADGQVLGDVQDVSFSGLSKDGISGSLVVRLLNLLLDSANAR